MAQKLDSIIQLTIQFEDLSKDFSQWLMEIKSAAFGAHSLEEAESRTFALQDILKCYSKLIEMAENANFDEIKNKSEIIKSDFEKLLKTFKTNHTSHTEKREKVKLEEKQHEENVRKFTELKIKFTKCQDLQDAADISKKQIELNALKTDLENIKSIELIGDITEFSVKVEKLIEEFEKIQENSDNFDNKLTVYKEWYKTNSTEPAGEITLDIDTNRETVSELESFKIELESGRSDLLSVCENSARKLSNYPNLQCARQVSALNSQLQILTTNANSKLKLYTETADKIERFLDSYNRADSLLKEAVDDCLNVDVERILLLVVQTEQISQQVSKVMKVSIELDTKTNELRQLYANCLRNYQYEQRLMKSQTVSDKLKQDEYSEKLKGYNRWFDDMNDRVNNYDQNRDQIGQFMRDNTLHTKREFLTKLTSDHQEILTYQNGVCNELLKMQDNLNLPISRPGADKKTNSDKNHINHQKKPFDTDELTALEKLCSGILQKTSDSVIIHEEYQKSLQNAEICMLDITSRNLPDVISHEDVKSVLKDIHSLRKTLDEMAEFWKRLHGPDSLCLDYESLNQAYNQQLIIAESKLRENQKEENSKFGNSVLESTQELESWARDKMDWVANKNKFQKLNSLSNLRQYVQEIKTVRLEAVANLEQHKLPLCERLIAVLDDELVHQESTAKMWEESLHKLANLENWLDSVSAEYNEFEFDTGLNDSSSDSRKLVKLRMGLQEVEKYQCVKLDVGTDEDSLARVEYAHSKLDDLHSNLSTQLVELEGQISLKTKRHQIEDSVNEQIVRLKASITSLLKNSNLPCLKKIQDAKTLLGRLETIEETLEFAETVSVAENVDSEKHNNSQIHENLKMLRNMLENMVKRLSKSWKTQNEIFDNLSKIESICSSHEATFIRKYANNLKISILSEKLDEIKQVLVQIGPYKTDLENNLLMKFEQSKGDLGSEEREKRTAKFEMVFGTVESLEKSLREIVSELVEKIDSRRSVLKMAQGLANWLQNEHVKIDKRLVLSTEVDGVVAVLQRYKVSFDKFLNVILPLFFFSYFFIQNLISQFKLFRPVFGKLVVTTLLFAYFLFVFFLFLLRVFALFCARFAFRSSPFWFTGTSLILRKFS